MSHVEKDKTERRDRLKRLKGRVEAIQRAIEDEACARVLQQATSCLSALDGAIAEVVPAI